MKNYCKRHFALPLYPKKHGKGNWRPKYNFFFHLKRILAVLHVRLVKLIHCWALFS
eukprot:08735.XXX_73621_73788_1 [CDS] Oithona nana genome sequencing.